MRKSLIAGLALALAAASPAFAKGGHHHGWGGGGGDQFQLEGTYVFEASGFANDNGNSGNEGEVAALGYLTLDGGNITGGTLTLTTDDNEPQPFTCTEGVGTGGKYSVTGSSAPGTGTLTLVLGNSSSGTLNFQLIVPGPDGKVAQVLESDTTLSVSICGQSINSMVLKGHLRRVDEGHDD